MQTRDITQQVERYYSAKLSEYGPTARGVDWTSSTSQELRFEQLIKVCDRKRPFTINDYGCGYGALVDSLGPLGVGFSYTGFDLSDAMAAEGERLYGARDDCRFTSDPDDLEPADFTVASGIFNVRLSIDDESWHAYVLETIAVLDALSRRGFGFNMLTGYSDPERMRADLYYANPARYFDHCMRRFPRRVALLHDYGLYEFTILVRLD
jgi:hypothetical protein